MDVGGREMRIHGQTFENFEANDKQNIVNYS